MNDWKEFFAAIFTILVLVTFIVLVVVIIRKDIKEYQKYETLIGEKVVIDKDTLTIVNYGGWINHFTLSNGVEVNQDKIELFLIKEKKKKDE